MRRRSMADRKLNLALIGCGGMAGGHLRSYLQIKETEPALFDLAACCDPVRELAEKFAATAENVRRGLSQRTAHWLLHERGLIGRPRLFFSQHASWSDPSPERNWHWRTEKALGGGGMIMDSGAHYCDTLRYLFGDIESV